MIPDYVERRIWLLSKQSPATRWCTFQQPSSTFGPVDASMSSRGVDFDHERMHLSTGMSASFTYHQLTITIKARKSYNILFLLNKTPMACFMLITCL